MELEVRKRRAQLHKYQGIGFGIVIVAVVYLLYMIFGMDTYYMIWAFGGGISFLVIVSVFLVYALLAAAGYLVMRKGSVKISEIMSEECDPFLYEACISKNRRGLYKDRILCNLALAQHYQGDYDREWQTLQGIHVQKLKGIFKVNYYILLCDQYFRRGMGLQVRDLEEAFRRSIRGKRDQKYFEMLCAGNNLTRALENEDYPSASKFLEERFDLNGGISKTWMRVLYAFKLAQVGIGLGEKESARLHLEYVVLKGNCMWCAGEAKRMLAEMEEGSTDIVSSEDESNSVSK